MIKVLLVDDEAIVRRGIKETINWEELGFEIVAEAVSGEDALQKYFDLKPNIIITDICMNSMDGLNLIKTIRGFDQEIEFVILSGYNYFEYAKKAISYGVNSYLLKPVDNNDLIDTMLSIKDKLDNKRNTKNSGADLCKDAHYNQCLVDILYTFDSREKIQDKLSGLMGSIPNGKYLISNIKIDNSMSMNDIETNHFGKILNECVAHYVGLESRQIIKLFLSNINIVLIVFENDADKLNADNLLNGIKTRFFELTSKTVTIGVSAVADKIDMLPEAYKQSEAALKYKIVSGRNKIYFYKDSNAVEQAYVPVFTHGEIEDFGRLILSRNADASFSMLETFFEKASKSPSVDINEFKGIVIELVSTIFRKGIRSQEGIRAIFKRDIQPVSEIYQLETFPDIYRWFKTFLKEFFDNYQFGEIYTYNPVIRNVLLYIMDHYAEKCTIKEVAEHFFISEGHLMRLFRAETGKTFNEYLTEYRINKAIALLETNRYKIYEVARMVGYTDCRYFSKVFKRLTGRNPKVYM